MKVFAQSLTLPDGTTFSGPLKFTNIGDVINASMPIVWAVLGMGMLIVMIMAGFTFLTSAGDQKKLQLAQSRLTYSVVGFLVVFLSYWIVQILGRMLGIAEFGQIFQ